MALEIRKSLVLSTAHIRKETNDLMSFWGDSLDSLSYCPTTYGYQVWVNSDLEEMVPEEFTAIFALARKHGCTYIEFDRDAMSIADLPSWEW